MEDDDDGRPPFSMEVKKHEKPGSLSPVKLAVKRDSGDEGKTSRSSSRCDKELRLPPEKSPSEDGALRRERRLSKTSDSSKETLDRQDSKSTSLTSPKVSRKYFTNWRQACDKTKDKTKELLKRWRTLPESEGAESPMQAAGHSDEDKHRGWSVHVWSTNLTDDEQTNERET
ncbi:hypothetical protein PYW08_008740 [Mythimna loreyi]|uniref:Uncharacterized protein n=1 Tax=Mythimna loreyi TaxID=667449 RepID=A0ACC2Q9A9_9NEOP|nr:hypothetical protein PYW08_008740 [Mythimna loreyi]